MRADRREILPATDLHASHAHAAQHEARHDVIHMIFNFFTSNVSYNRYVYPIK